MASLNCDILFSYNNRREYIGEFNYRNVISMELQHIYPASGSHPSQGYAVVGIPANPSEIQEIIINGENFGSGRILSASVPTSADITQDGATFWKQVLSIEVTENGDADSLPNETLINQAFHGVSSIYNKNISSIDESFQFSIEDNGQKSYTHSASATCIDDVSNGTSGWITARSVASGLLASQPPFGYAVLQLYTGIGKRTYQEVYDKLNGTVSFTENFELQQNEYSNQITFSNGVFSVSESVRLTNTGTALTADAAFSSSLNTSLQTYLDGSWTRCDSLYSVYATSVGTDAFSTNLFDTRIEINKGFSEESQEMFYDVTYTNNPELYNGSYTISRQQRITKDNIGIINAFESCEISSHLSKSSALQADLITKIGENLAGAVGRLTNYYANAAQLKTRNLSRVIPSHNKNASYQVEYSSDKSLIQDGIFMTRIVNLTDNIPIRKHEPYIIMGWKEPLVHDPGLTEMGRISVNVEAELQMPSTYTQSSPQKPTSQLNTMFLLALDRGLAKIAQKSPIDWYVSRTSYGYTWDYRATLTIEISYIYARETIL